MLRKPPFFGRMFHRFAEHTTDCSVSATEYCGHDDLPAETREEADLVSSKVSEFYHAPVIDIDIPCQLVESSPGHHHLYIDAPIRWEQYLAMLKAMAEAGVVQAGYVAAAERRGYTSVRLPEKLKPWPAYPAGDAPF